MGGRLGRSWEHRPDHRSDRRLNHGSEHYFRRRAESGFEQQASWGRVRFGRLEFGRLKFGRHECSVSPVSMRKSVISAGVGNGTEVVVGAGVGVRVRVGIRVRVGAEVKIYVDVGVVVTVDVVTEVVGAGVVTGVV